MCKNKIFQRLEMKNELFQSLGSQNELNIKLKEENNSLTYYLLFTTTSRQL